MRNLALSLGCFAVSSMCMAQTMNWVQVKTRNSPPARWVHGMAHDLVRGRTVVFGGQSGSANLRNDTWEYDGRDWVEIKPKTVPPARRYQSMAFHLARLRTVMFGGIGQTSYVNDTWVWNGGDWAQMKPKNSPSARKGHAMAYDSSRQRTVLFGGRNSGGAYLADTWEWDGSSWTQVTTTNSPTPRQSHGMAYDSARKRIVLFGGSPHTQDTWEYDGKSWVQMNPTTKPTIRSWHAMAYDTARRRTVIFAGYYAQFGTWEYDGKDWTRIRTRDEPGDFGTRWGNEIMVYDSRRKRMVLYGGITVNQKYPNDTWEYGPSQSLIGSPRTISIATGGTYKLSLEAGTVNANRPYWVLGSASGTTPGVTLASAVGSVTLPLNPDPYTDITIALTNTALLTKTRGRLGSASMAFASLNVPKTLPTAAIGLRLYHAYLVYDAQNNFYMASNPVELMLVK